MRKGLLLLCCLLLMVCGAGRAMAAEATNVTDACAITLGKSNVKGMAKALDGRYGTYTAVAKGGKITIDSQGKPMSGLYLQFFSRTTSTVVEAEVDGAWQTACEAGEYLTQWCPLPEGTTRARIVNTDTSRLFLAEMSVWGGGERPAAIPVWEKADKVDIMLLVAHPDDELLWFGGLLPEYAGERGLKVQVVYAVSSTPNRRLELLDGLWHCGVRAYPEFLNMPDKRANSLRGIYRTWHKDVVYKRVTEQIRKHQPSVLVTQDFEGEYGHGAHRAMADACASAVHWAAEADQYPESAEAYGTWQVQKLYIHLYPENEIQLDWHKPLSAFNGKDGMTIATEALACHKSQVIKGWKMEEGGETDNSRLGLYYTAVGMDIAGNDLMENVDTELLLDETAE